MLIAEFKLLTGRYHATPWGRHVNEGAVEWPPSPWRLLRALIATGYSKLGWTDVPEEAAQLLTSLARVLPDYGIPRATSAHTRHYMPAYEGTKLRSDKVIDAFVHVESAASLVVIWPVTVDDRERELFGRLLASMSYLGRAETWVEARCVDAIPHDVLRCEAAESPPRRGWERVPLLASTSAEEYDDWRQREVARALEDALASETARAVAKGKKGPAKLAAAAAARAARPYPADLVSCLRADTDTLRGFGWTQPPGSRWVSYWLPGDALASRNPIAPTRPRERRPTVALLAISSDTQHGNRYPRLQDAVLRMDALHEALVRRSDVGEGPSPCFTGQADGRPLEGHQHGELIPLDLAGGRGSWMGQDHRVIDHILVHARMGFDDRALHALRTIERTFAKQFVFFVSLIGLGDPSDSELFEAAPSLRLAARWESSTPFVPPRYLKPRGKDDLAGQVRRELESRGFPPAHVEVETLDSTRTAQWVAASGIPEPSPRYRHHRRARLDGARRPPMAHGFHLRLAFDEPVRGPICLGYGSHFGLGTFAPVTEN